MTVQANVLGLRKRMCPLCAAPTRTAITTAELRAVMLLSGGGWLVLLGSYLLSLLLLLLLRGELLELVAIGLRFIVIGGVFVEVL